jgi:hypothetical protein
MPRDFLESAAAHLRRLRGLDAEYAVPAKASAYNAGVFLGLCARCSARPAVHTHHRTPQAVARARVKHSAHNLEPLCAECHALHHRLERVGRDVPTRRVQTAAGIAEVPLIFDS